MTTRIYDYNLVMGNVANFVKGSIIRGNSSKAIGQVQAVDYNNNYLKVKMLNVYTDFTVNEYIHANAITTWGIANGAINTTSLPFQSNIFTGNTTYASNAIVSIVPNSVFANKNSFVQAPIVRLYSLYYPGEWYPPNDAGNPTRDGAGRSWPVNFPIRFAEIIGDVAEDASYKVTLGGVDYIPMPVDISGFEQASDGKINDVSMKIYNFDNLISRLVEDPFLAGNNSSNSVYGIVNGELVNGLDPRTVNASPTNMGAFNTPPYNALAAARAAGLNYDINIVNYYGKANASFDKTQTDLVRGTWVKDITDSRDLLGGVLEVKSVFANSLDFWPEYSLIQDKTDNVLTLYDASSYRVGDTVTLNRPGWTTSNIASVSEDIVTLDKAFIKYAKMNSFPTGIFMDTSGRYLYVGDSTQFSNIAQYYLSTPYDITTASLQKTKAIRDLIGVSSGRVQGFTFSPSRSNLYIYTRSNIIWQCNLAVAGDISTASLRHSFDTTAYETMASGVAIGRQGNNLWFTGQNSKNVYQLSMSTSWNLATASLTATANLAPWVTSIGDLHVDYYGKQFFVSNTAEKTMYRFSLATNFDFSSTVTLLEKTDVSNYIPNNLNGVALTKEGFNVYFAGSSSILYQAQLRDNKVLGSLYQLPAADYVGDPLYIVNNLADPDSYAIDRFKIDQLESLTEYVATFGLVSWLQYFRLVTPKRKYYKNTCQFVYKGEECKYPGYGGKTIPDTNLVSPATPIKSDNTVGSLPSDDVCSKSITGCRLRNNSVHFGGFIGVGRTVPRM